MLFPNPIETKGSKLPNKYINHGSGQIFMAMMEKYGRAWNVKIEPVGPQGRGRNIRVCKRHSISDGPTTNYHPRIQRVEQT